MLITWLRTTLIFIAKLFIPGPAVRTRINPSAPCPACGGCKGTIETAQVGQKIVVQHNCLTCKCHWYEDPIRTDVAIRAATAVTPPAKA